MKVTGLPLVVLFGISVAAYGGMHLGSGQSTNTTVALNVAATAAPQSPQVLAQANVPPLKPYPRLLPLQLIAPTTAYAGTPLEGVSVSLQNPGNQAPNAMLRLIIHEQATFHPGGHHTLNPGSVKVEVLEGGAWKPVTLGLVAGGLMGAIGPEGVAIQHSERFKHDGFAIPAGLDKTWQLRLTFSTPGTYTFVTAVSPDNGSRHLAQPAHSTIVVQ